MSISITYQKSKQKSSDRGWSLSGKFRILKRRYNDKRKAKLYSDLHLLLSSGLDINSILEILISQTSSQWESIILKSVKQNIISGASLADSLKQDSIAGDYEYYALKIGEESGKIVEVLKEIKNYFNRKINQRRQVSKAMTYPLMVLFTALLAVGFMLNVIVPMFEEVFNRFQGNLPLLTQRIINLSGWMKQYSWLLLLIIFGLFAILLRIRKENWYKRILHKLLLYIPVFGKLIKNIQIARFCHIMSLLTGAKSPLVQSLNLVSEMIQFVPLKNAIQKTSIGISSGESFYNSIDNTGFFDKKFSSLIKAAEEVNKLDFAFSQLNDQYNQEIDHNLSIMGNLMEPILIMFVGGIVAVILIAMYLPLFQIGTSIY